mgnify:CR=1 FL=1
MIELDNTQPAQTAAMAPGTTATPDAARILTEEDRAALNGITLAVEFAMVAARALSRGFPKDHPEVAEYLAFARAKLPA